MILRDNNDRAILAVNWLVAASISMLVAAFSMLLFIMVGAKAGKGAPVFTVLIAVLMLVSLLVLFVACIGSGITFIQWFRRGYWNLRELGFYNLSYSNGMAAGAWFIPIGNLFIPVQIMREIWTHTQWAIYSIKGNSGNPPEKPDMVSTWWALYIIGSMVSNLSNFDKRNEMLQFVFFVISFTLMGIAGFILCKIIKKVQVWQNELRDLVNFADEPIVPGPFAPGQQPT